MFYDIQDSTVLSIHNTYSKGEVGGRRGFVLFAKPLFHPTNETPLIQIMMCFRHIYHCRFALPLPEPNVQSGSPDVKGILLAS